MVKLESYNIKSRKCFAIRSSIVLNHSLIEVWELITRPGHLMLYHPFCKRHEHISHYHLGAIDEAEFNSGVIKRREVVCWKENEGYTIKLHGKKNMHTLVHWVITAAGISRSTLTITIESFAYKNIPRPIWHLYAKYLLIPSFSNYLNSLLSGIEYYLDTGEKVQKNQFGKHKKFSP